MIFLATGSAEYASACGRYVLRFTRHENVEVSVDEHGAGRPWRLTQRSLGEAMTFCQERWQRLQASATHGDAEQTSAQA